jgi:hypothetical protein
MAQKKLYNSVIPDLIRDPVFKYWSSAFAGTTSGFLLEFTPYLSIRPDHGIRGRNDSFGTGYQGHRPKFFPDILIT